MTTRPLTPAERQRQYRARVNRHCFMTWVELTEERLSVLTAGDAPWLDEKDARDPRACGEAIGRILDGLIKKPLRVTPTPREPD